MYGMQKGPLNSPRLCRKKDLEKFRDRLKIGTEYKLTKITTSRDEGQGTKKLRRVRYMRLVEKHPHIATFEDENGFLTSYGYWELRKLIRGEEYL